MTQIVVSKITTKTKVSLANQSQDFNRTTTQLLKLTILNQERQWMIRLNQEHQLTLQICLCLILVIFKKSFRVSKIKFLSLKRNCFILSKVVLTLSCLQGILIKLLKKKLLLKLIHKERKETRNMISQTYKTKYSHLRKNKTTKKRT